jgi:hypothetical protein
MHEDLVHNKIISCIKSTELKQLGKFLYKLKRKYVDLNHV